MAPKNFQKESFYGVTLCARALLVKSLSFIFLKQTQLSASFVQREVARDSVTEGLFLLKSSASLHLCVIQWQEKLLSQMLLPPEVSRLAVTEGLFLFKQIAILHFAFKSFLADFFLSFHHRRRDLPQLSLCLVVKRAPNLKYLHFLTAKVGKRFRSRFTFNSGK